MSTFAGNVIKYFVCPICKSELVITSRQFYCNNCQRKFTKRDSLYNFVTQEGKYSDAADEIMDNILLKMDSLPWLEVIYRAFAEKNPWLYQIITDFTRTDYLFLQEFSKQDLVLDVGSGWGQSAFALAKHVKEVIAVEPNSKRINFIAKRINQEKVDNILPVQATSRRLPFK